MRHLVNRFLAKLPSELREQQRQWLPRLGEDVFFKPRGWERLVRPHGPAAETQAGLPEDLVQGVAAAQERILRLQNRDEGYWNPPLLADTTLESDAIMLWNFLGRGGSPRVQKLARTLLAQQLPDGGWPIYKNGPAELSATVKAYWGLKFAGHAADEAPLVRARERIAALGGIHRVNTYTKFYMALFGQYDWRGVPTIPPEMVLFPSWFYFSIYDMSSWTRAIVLPLSIVWAKRPRVFCPAHATLDELFGDGRRWAPLSETMPKAGWVSWQSFFLGVDRLLKGVEGRLPGFLRSYSLESVNELILTHLEGSDGLGAIYPGVLNTIMALKVLGYPDHDPVLKREIAHFEALELDHGESLELQPCTAPVWDTAISVAALGESGLRRDHPAMVKAVRWLLSKEIQRAGDWRVKNPDGPVGGWAFQFNNPWYPDVDDTAMVLHALRQAHVDDPLADARERAFKRGLDWILSMQCKEGGWAAFDRDNTKAVLTKIPFADHNAMIDPPCEDITGRVLELLGKLGYTEKDPCVARGAEFLFATQLGDGSWFGRWCVNYIYGTFLALRGLAAVGHDRTDPRIGRAAHWLLSVQRPDGGWGETCRTYDDPSAKGAGPSTPSQTAWALMGLIASGHTLDAQVLAGVEFLLRTQREDGGWDETEFTGTGFPKVFYLEYTMYRDYFPLMALGAFRRALLEKKEATPASA